MTTRVTARPPADPAPSFRDPDGHVFYHGGVPHRALSPAYEADFRHLHDSGLHRILLDRGWLLPHQDAPGVPHPAGAGRVLRPLTLPWVTAPSEWTAPQLRAAALLTLAVEREAGAHGMTLKDARADNVQFLGHRPVLADLSSLRLSRPGEPWLAYRQFCEQFLAPLALAAWRDVRLLRRLRPEAGVPLDLAARLLPRRARIRPGIALHLAAHARAVARAVAQAPSDPRRPLPTMSKTARTALVESLERTLRRLPDRPPAGPWASYDRSASYTEAGLAAKRATVEAWLDRLRPASVLDVGANDGAFARLASARGIPTLAWEADEAAAHRLATDAQGRADRHLVAAVVDAADPTPPGGWALAERASALDRGRAGLVLALALVHHVCLAGGVPLDRFVDLLARLGHHAAVEFVPPDDPQARRIAPPEGLRRPAYGAAEFLQAAGARFCVLDDVPLPGGTRRLFLLERREA